MAQTGAAYSYAGDNPTANIDPTGLDAGCYDVGPVVICGGPPPPNPLPAIGQFANGVGQGFADIGNGIAHGASAVWNSIFGGSDDASGETPAEQEEEGACALDAAEAGPVESLQDAEGADNAELARNIAGHASVHFPGSEEETAQIIEDILNSDDAIRTPLNNGRTGYYEDGVVVVVNPGEAYGGTAYPGSFDDFLKLR